MKTPHHEAQKTNDRSCGATRRQRSAAVRAAAAVLLVFGAAGWPMSSPAQAVAGPQTALRDLEKSFWICDHAATNGRVHGSTAITCGGITEDLMQRKFNADFGAMLAWWQQHKEAQYLALDKTSGESLAGLVPNAAK